VTRAGRQPRRRAARGFSLLEILVALTVAALVLAPLFQVFGTGLRTARIGDAYTRATLLAQSRLAAFGVERTGRDGTQEGVSEDGMRWQVRAVPLPWEAETPSLLMRARPFVVRVEVHWDDGARGRSLALESVRLVPDR